MGGRRRPTDEAGQTATELVGVMGLVTAILVAVLALNPAMANDVSTTLQQAVCRALRLGCGQGTGPHGPSTPCLTASDSGDRNLGLTIASVKLGNLETMLRETFSDGSVRITASSNGSLGAKFGAGGKASLDLGKFQLGAGANADVVVGGAVEGGQTWYFPNAAAADQFEQRVKDTVADSRRWSLNPLQMALGWSPWGGETFGDAGQWSAAADSVRGPTTFYVKAGPNVTGSAGAYGGPAYVDGKAGANAYLGTLFNNQTHQQTNFFEVGVNGQVGGGVLLLASPQAAGDGKVVVAVTSDQSGRPISAKVTVTGKGAVSDDALRLAQGSGVTANAAEWLKKAKARGLTTNDGMWQLNATVPLDNPQTTDALAHVLSGQPGGLHDLSQQLENTSQVTIATYNGNGSDVGIDGEVEAGLVIGGEAGYKTSDVHVTSASYLTPSGFIPWVSCR